VSGTVVCAGQRSLDGAAAKIELSQSHRKISRLAVCIFADEMPTLSTDRDCCV
jgi:hypothetical protein